MTRAQRRFWLSFGFLAVGLCGLTVLFLTVRSQPWLRRGLLLVLVWQVFWWLVRLWLTIGIWGREPELSAGQKVWVAISAPLPVLVAIWMGRGRLSAWVAAGGEEDHADQ